MDEEMARQFQERVDAQKRLLDKQTHELGEFDYQSSTMGLDTERIVEATMHSAVSNADDDIDLPVHGSTLSLASSALRSSGRGTSLQLTMAVSTSQLTTMGNVRWD